MKKTWIEIKAAGPREKMDEAAFFLFQAGSPGVIEDEAFTDGPLLSHSSWDSKDEVISASAEVTYKAYLQDPAPGTLAALDGDLKALGWAFATAPFKDRDWSRKWMSGIRPVRVSSRGKAVIVKPTWRNVRKSPGDIVIDIDPGMAFGTGSHATTKMCLKAIIHFYGDYRGSGSSILDAGTGTGILAIAAKKLGVKKAVGNDLDGVALGIARKNAKLNKAAVTLTRRSLEKINGAFSMVVANILRGELIRLLPALVGKTAPGGLLIISGILKTETPSLKEAFGGAGLKHVKSYSSGEWAALVFRKSAGR